MALRLTGRNECLTDIVQFAGNGLSTALERSSRQELAEGTAIGKLPHSTTNLAPQDSLALTEGVVSQRIGFRSPMPWPHAPRIGGLAAKLANFASEKPVQIRSHLDENGLSDYLTLTYGVARSLARPLL